MAATDSPTKETLFADPAPCCMPDADGCVCGREERALRAVILGQYRALIQPERDWCKRIIVSTEGYNETDAEGADVDVARMVLSAWTDYCRDQGLIS